MYFFNKKSYLTILIFFFSTISFIYSGESERKNNHALSIDLSISTPLFMTDYSKIESLKLYPGGLGALSYEYFIDNHLSLGFELRYNFNFDINFSMDFLNPDSSTGDTFSSFPITFLINYVFDLGPNFHIPLFSNLGLSINSYGKETEQATGKKQRTIDVTPAISFGSGFMWDFHYKWSIGLSLGFWILPEFGAEGSGARTATFLISSFVVKANLSK